MIRRQVEPVPAAGARSPPIGDSLRQQREQLGWSLDEVAGWLRIRRSYLQALEDGRPDALPAGTYTIGFLRSYAVALGLDPQTAVERFRRESSGHLGHPDLSFPSPVPERGVPAGAAILLGVVLLIGAYAGWYVFSARDSVPVQAVPEVPDAMLAAPAPAARPAVAPGPGTPAASKAVVSSPVVPALRSIASPRPAAPNTPGRHCRARPGPGNTGFGFTADGAAAGNLAERGQAQGTGHNLGAGSQGGRNRAVRPSACPGRYLGGAGGDAATAAHHRQCRRAGARRG